MQLYFTFRNLKPCSTNKVWRNSKRGVYKSKEANLFEQRVTLLLLKKKREIEDFEAKFDINKSHLACSVKIYVPKSILLTKKGYISSRNLDLDNILKNLIDAVFKSFNKLGDHYIRSFSFIESLASEDNNYNIEISLKSRSNDHLFPDLNSSME